MYMLFNRYFSPRVVLLFFSEFAIIFLTVLLVALARFKMDSSEVAMYDPYLLKSIVMYATYMAVFYYTDLYSPDLYSPGRQMILKLLEALAIATVILFSIYYIFPQLKVWRGILLANMVSIPVVMIVWRRLFSLNHSSEAPVKGVIIIGTGDLAKKIGTSIYTSMQGLKLVGFIDDDPEMFGKSIVNPGVIGCTGDIARVVREQHVDHVIVALPDRRAKLPIWALLDCKLNGVSIEDGETFQERMTGKIPLDHLKPSWMVFSDGFKSLRSRKTMKRAIDLVLAVAGAVVALPFFLVTSLLIKLDSKGPVLFKQTRVGEHGREFTIYKFRSMREDAESKSGPVWAQTEDDRVTRVGKVIRKLRIDELPQLINVIKGDMSFVGPRPERPFFVNELKKVIPYYEIRTVIKPGLTGWAQIKYRYGASVEDAMEKLQYDIYYIKNMSPLLDVMIFFWTIKVVLGGKGR